MQSVVAPLFSHVPFQRTALHEVATLVQNACLAGREKANVMVAKNVSSTMAQCIVATAHNDGLHSAYLFITHVYNFGIAWCFIPCADTHTHIAKADVVDDAVL